MFDCVIVGFGPVGALLSLFLSKQNLKVAIIDKNKEIYPLPRAIHFDEEIMRIFQMIGLSEKISSIARIGTKGMHFVDDNNNLLMVRKGSERVGDQGWQKSWYFHQPELEKVLRKEVKSSKLVKCYLGFQAKSIKQDDCEVQLTCVENNNKKELCLKSRFLIGCDGANSIVGSYIGGETIDYGLKEKYLVVDLKVDNRFKKVNDLPDYTVQHCSLKRPATRCYISKKRRRWEIKVLPSDKENEIKKEKNIWKFLNKWIDKRCGYIERAEIYTFKSTIKKNWFKGRVFLAGDSAHLSPPFLGQGMCAGVRDVASLSWRLHCYLKQGFPKSILKSYQTERLPHVKKFIQLATECGRIMSDPKINLKTNKKGNTKLFDFPRPRLEHGFFKRSELSGTLLPQFIEKNVKTDERLKYNFILLSRVPGQQKLSHNLKRFVKTIKASGEIRNWMENNGQLAVLIRPDKYIFSGAKNEIEVSDLLEHLSQLSKKNKLFSY